MEQKFTVYCIKAEKTCPRHPKGWTVQGVNKCRDCHFASYECNSLLIADAHSEEEWLRLTDRVGP